MYQGSGFRSGLVIDHTLAFGLDHIRLEGKTAVYLLRTASLATLQHSLSEPRLPCRAQNWNFPESSRAIAALLIKSNKSRS